MIKLPIDFDRHNTEVSQMWDAYHRREPTRVPIILVSNPRYTMFNHPANPRNTQFKEYSNDPMTMMVRQGEHQHWIRHNLLQDTEMGMPRDGWSVYVDLQNTYDAAWLGGETSYFDGEVPDIKAWLTDDIKQSFLDDGLPDLFEGGGMGAMWDFYDFIVAKKEEGWTWMGLPIASVEPSGMGFDGPLTVVCNVRGAAEFLTDLVADPDYAQNMLEFLTEGAIARVTAYRKHLGRELKTAGCFIADDSIQLISTPMYTELIMPHHRRYLGAIATEGPKGMHLCGDATRHFSTLRDELNVVSFDTGFPVDFTWLRESVGSGVEIMGGPSVPFLESATPSEVSAEVKRILASGITEGGRFVLREGNNLGPGVSQENCRAMYEAGIAYGAYD